MKYTPLTTSSSATTAAAAANSRGLRSRFFRVMLVGPSDSGIGQRAPGGIGPGGLGEIGQGGFARSATGVGGFGPGAPPSAMEAASDRSVWPTVANGIA